MAKAEDRRAREMKEGLPGLKPGAAYRFGGFPSDELPPGPGPPLAFSIGKGLLH